MHSRQPRSALLSAGRYRRHNSVQRCGKPVKRLGIAVLQFKLKFGNRLGRVTRVDAAAVERHLDQRVVIPHRTKCTFNVRDKYRLKGRRLAEEIRHRRLGNPIEVRNFRPHRPLPFVTPKRPVPLTLQLQRLYEALAATTHAQGDALAEEISGRRIEICGDLMQASHIGRLQSRMPVHHFLRVGRQMKLDLQL